MKNRLLPLTAIISAVFFTFLFSDVDSGLNVAIFATFFLAALWFVFRQTPMKSIFWFFAVNVLVLSWAYAIHGNYFTRFAILINYLFLAGSLALKEVNHTVPLIREWLLQFPLSQKRFVEQAMPKLAGRNLGTNLKYRLMYGLPAVALIAVFIFFYRNSNRIFDSYVSRASLFFEDIFKGIDLPTVFTFLLGLILVNGFLFSISRTKVVKHWLNRSSFITRLRKRKNTFMRNKGLVKKLQFEYKAGIFLIVVLNLLLLFLNIADLRLVWFGFEWKGQLLKDFVHEGTWYLIVSICISALTILYFFRGNINFYRKNAGLKWLVNIWLAQNAFLALSVLVRNLKYIDHYGLAYLRIGVFFFLAAVLCLLFFVYLKVSRREEMHLLLHRNIVASVSLLSLCALVDWSAIITRYNLANYQRSFVHMEFLAHMPDRCLPVLNEYRDNLEDIKTSQWKKGFGYREEVTEGKLEDYLDNRIAAFRNAYEHRKWQELTLADARAYRALGR